jgi:cytochrome P450
MTTNPPSQSPVSFPVCLGAPLARLEAKIALGVMFERLDEIERVPDVPLEAVVSPLGYGMKRLLITFKRK